MPPKRVTKRRPRRTRKVTNKNLARRVKRLEKRPELKYHDVYSTTGPTAAGTANSMLFIAQGDDFNQRIGEEITAMYLNLNLRLTATVNTVVSYIRTMIVWDKQNNGTGPVFLASSSLAEGLLDDTTITSSILSPHNYRTKQRYVILYDKLHLLTPQSAGTEVAMKLRRNFKLRGAKVKYSSSGATVADLPSRDLIYVQFSTVASTITVLNSFRLWYTDQ